MNMEQLYGRLFREQRRRYYHTLRWPSLKGEAWNKFISDQVLQFKSISNALPSDLLSSKQAAHTPVPHKKNFERNARSRYRSELSPQVFRRSVSAKAIARKAKVRCKKLDTLLDTCDSLKATVKRQGVQQQSHLQGHLDSLKALDKSRDPD